ncbi:MAG TPA: hypothetical protein VFH76_09360 [Kribbella sp.]|nr:hypothetical protein [Kribbella sp.]
MRELKPEAVWAEFDAPSGQLSRAVARCMVFACAVGLLVLLGTHWLYVERSSGSSDEYFTAPQIALRFTIVLLPTMLAVYVLALVLLVIRPAEALLSVVAAAVGLVSTVVVLLSGPHDVQLHGEQLADYRWQAAPYLALILWAIAVLLTARMRRLVRNG